MEQSTLTDVIECSGCEQQIPNGSSIYVLCAQCAFDILNVPDPAQLTLFELPLGSEVH